MEVSLDYNTFEAFLAMIIIIIIINIIIIIIIVIIIIIRGNNKIQVNEAYYH